MAGAEITHAGHGAHGNDAGHVSHPRARSYVFIFFILLAVTILEVLVTQEPLSGIILSLGSPLIVPLLILAALKFGMIAAFYMHLKQDSRVFTAFFILGLILAVGMLFTFMGLFTAHSREPFDEVAWREELAAQSGSGTDSATRGGTESGATGSTAAGSGGR